MGSQGHTTAVSRCSQRSTMKVKRYEATSGAHRTDDPACIRTAHQETIKLRASHFVKYNIMRILTTVHSLTELRLSTLQASTQSDLTGTTSNNHGLLTWTLEREKRSSWGRSALRELPAAFRGASTPKPITSSGIEI